MFLPQKTHEFILYFLKKQKKYLIFYIISLFIWGLHTALVPYSMKMLIDNINNYYNSISVDKAELSIWQYSKIAIFLVIIFNITKLVNIRIMDLLQMLLFTPIQRDMRIEVSHYVIKHSYKFFQNNLCGDIASRIISISNEISIILRTLLKGILGASMSLIIGMISGYLIHPYLGLILFIWIASCVYIGVFLSKTVFNHSGEFASAAAKFSGKITDTFNNINTVRSCASEFQELHYLKKYIYKLHDKYKILLKKILRNQLIVNLLTGITIVFCIITLIHLCNRNVVTLGDFVFIIALVQALSIDVWWISNQIQELIQGLGTFTKNISIITLPHDINDHKDAKVLQVIDGDIEFKDVCFSYDNMKAIFSNFNLKIKSGEKVGIVGLSGSGKSTFINVLMRNFDIESGKIMIDQQDISLVTQESLRKSITYVPQDIMLFYRSVLENVIYPDTEIDDKLLEKVIEYTECKAFIEKLPQRIDSLVGEKGIKLSTGQRQRIAIARAMLNKEAKIFILDEATSALDTITENKIQNGIKHLIGSTTTIAIAHRLSTLSIMDRILVFDDGKIVEDGTQDDLLKINNGYYKKLHDNQHSGFLPSIEND